MAPPVAAATGEELDKDGATPKEATFTGSQTGGEATPKSPTAKSEKGKSKGDIKAAPKGGEISKDGELSGKDKKMKAKAEKMARRAQEKQKQPGQPMVDAPGANHTDTTKKPARRGSTAAPKQAPKPHHNRSGSTSQKVLPVRPADSQTSQTPVEARKEEKKVALFDHLYGQPRRTTLAGAGKDIHPAVLTLGLQMSSYVICGSNARCVAMLLAFKEVGFPKLACIFMVLTRSRPFNHTVHLRRRHLHGT